MSLFSSKIFCGAFVLWVFVGCGSAQQQEEYREAGVVAGVAAVAQVVQTARAQPAAAQSQPNTRGPCCAVCRTCEFPCGDRCLPYGTVCVDPPGCACTDAPGEARHQPREGGPPFGCPTEPSVILPIAQ
jgi:hypothetical protein